MSTGGLDSEAGLAFSLYAPTPLAEGWAFARAQQGGPGERLARRLAFVEHALWLLVGVLDAERISLGLPSPKKRDELVRRLEKPTLGLQAEAAVGLARALCATNGSVLAELAEQIAAADGPFERALSRLIDIRNEVMHDAYGQPSDDLAQRYLDETARALRAIMLTLDVLKQTPIIAIDEITDRLDGSGDANVLVFRGPEPQLVSLSLATKLPKRWPMLLAPNGLVLMLAPWIMYSDFGGSGLPHLRLLCKWKDGPLFGRVGVLKPDPCGDLVAFCGKDPEPLFANTRPLPRAPDAALAKLWERIGQPGDQAPPQIPGFSVERLLGRGASGTVWLARAEATGSRAALKVLHPALAENQHQRARMEREHRMLRQVSHPGVARVYDLLPSTPVGPVLVMEAVEGTPLNVYAAENPFDPTSAALLAGKVLAALGAIHAQGLVHRDVKPANILLDLHGEPRLVDFGVARSADLSTLTGSMDVVGTQAFAAPEQLLGAEVDGRADLFAVGRMLPTLCSAEGDWNTRLGRLPGALQCIVRRATQEDPNQRYPNAAAMQQALQAREVEGWDGPPVGVGDLLPGGLRLVRQLELSKADIFLFQATPITEGSPVAVLVASAGAKGQDALKTALDRCGAELRNNARCPGLRVTRDGLAYAELRADNAEQWAGRLMGVAEKAKDWTETIAVGAVLGGLATATVAGLAAVFGLGAASRAAQKNRAATPNPTLGRATTAAPTREVILRSAQLHGLLLHALAHASGEAAVNPDLWLKLCSSALKAPLRVLGHEGDAWPGPVGRAIAQVENRPALVAGIAALSGQTLTPAALKNAGHADQALRHVLALALDNGAPKNPAPYARLAGDVWEVMVPQQGQARWMRVG